MGNIMNMMKEMEGLEKQGKLGDLMSMMGGGKKKRKR